MADPNNMASTGPKRGSLWEPGLQQVFENESGRRIMQQVALKKEIRKGRLLFETTAQSLSPSKDFVSLVITEKGIIWSKWKITLRGYTSGTAPVPQPVEEVMSFTDFKCNDALLDEVKRAFGENTYHHIDHIISGSNDPLSCTPEPIMLRICSMLDLESISQLANVNKYLRKLCTSDKLWSLLYMEYQGNPTPEVCFLANEIGWKKLFYMSKLQLQKEMSRRRTAFMKHAMTNTGGPRVSVGSDTLSPVRSGASASSGGGSEKTTPPPSAAFGKTSLTVGGGIAAHGSSASANLPVRELGVASPTKHSISENVMGTRATGEAFITEKA